MSLQQRPPAGGPQLAHVAVRPAVAAAHLLIRLAFAGAPGGPLARRVPALQAVPARRQLVPGARLAFRPGAHQAAVAAVRHVAAWAAGARTRADVTTARTDPVRGLRGFGDGRIRED